MAPMRFIDLVDSLISNTDERAAIDDLLKIKRSVSESEYGPSIPTLNTIIKRLFSTLDHVELPTKQPDAQLLDLLLMESVMHNHSSLRS
jgi:predicted nucleotidyltransferase